MVSFPPSGTGNIGDGWDMDEEFSNISKPSDKDEIINKSKGAKIEKIGTETELVGEKVKKELAPEQIAAETAQKLEES